MVMIKNGAKGARGIRMKDNRVVTVNPGQTIQVDGANIGSMAAGLAEVSGHEVAQQAKSELPDPPANLDLDKPPSLSGKNKGELEDIATAEGVDLAAIQGTGNDGFVTAKDIKDAIEAKR